MKRSLFACSICVVGCSVSASQQITSALPQTLMEKRAQLFLQEGAVDQKHTDVLTKFLQERENAATKILKSKNFEQVQNAEQHLMYCWNFPDAVHNAENRYFYEFASNKTDEAARCFYEALFARMIAEHARYWIAKRCNVTVPDNEDFFDLLCRDPFEEIKDKQKKPVITDYEAKVVSLCESEALAAAILKKLGEKS